MSMLMAPAFIAVKSEPQETEHVEQKFISDSTNISIIHNIDTETPTEPFNYITIDQKPLINAYIESNSNLSHYDNDLCLSSVSSEISSPDLVPTDVQCSNTEFRYQIEPKEEVDTEIVHPLSLISDSTTGEFVNILNDTDCKVEPTSLLHESIPSKDPLEISSLEQQINQADELLKQKHQINESIVSVQRLNIYSYRFAIKITSPSCFKCRFCPKFLVSSRGIIRHEKTHLGRMRCDYCKKDYVDRRTLVTHIKCKHSGLIFKCSVCDKILSTRRILQKHMEVHTKPHQCPHCVLSFSHKAVLENHIGSHLGKQFKCDQCHLSFGSLRYLSKHKSVHEAKPKPKRKRCGFCRKSYARNEGLQIHIKEKHTDPKNFAFHCMFCQKSFATADTYHQHRYYVHISPYDRRRTYTCDVCNNTYRGYKAFQYHKKEHT